MFLCYYILRTLFFLAIINNEFSFYCFFLIFILDLSIPSIPLVLPIDVLADISRNGFSNFHDNVQDPSLCSWLISLYVWYFCTFAIWLNILNTWTWITWMFFLVFNPICLCYPASNKNGCNFHTHSPSSIRQ